MGEVPPVEVQASQYTWAQSIEEITVSIPVPEGTRGKDVTVDIRNDHLEVRAPGDVHLAGDLAGRVNVGESTWSIEDRKRVVVLLVKATEHEVWPSLIVGRDEVDPMSLKQIKENMMLEKFQNKHPGFDFRGATFNGEVPENGANFMEKQ